MSYFERKCQKHDFRKKSLIFQEILALQPNLTLPPTKLQFSKAESGKDYWLKVSKQKKAKRQGVDDPALPSSPSDGYADNSKVPVCPY